MKLLTPKRWLLVVLLAASLLPLADAQASGTAASPPPAPATLRPAAYPLMAKKKKDGEKSRSTADCGAETPVYDGPLFDAMAQIDEMVDWDEAIARVRRAGVSKLALFARSRKGLGENEEFLLEFAAKHRDLIVLGAPKYFLLDGDLDGAFIDETIAGIRKHGYAFVGEILYTHGDKSHGEQTAFGERYVDPSRPGTARLLRLLAPLLVPLMTHWEVYAWERDWPKFDALYRASPRQVFILPHMAFGSAAQVRTMMERHPNLHMTISKEDKGQRSLSDPSKADRLGGAIIDRCGALKPQWKPLLLTYRRRMLFATDAHKRDRWRQYEKHVKSMRRILGQLPEEVARDIAYRNAERLYKTHLTDSR